MTSAAIEDAIMLPSVTLSYPQYRPLGDLSACIERKCVKSP